MSTLIERLNEVMTACRWSQADLVRISGQSHSVVSQWLGKGSKEIKSIGKLEAAEAIEAASGFAALWIAKGSGPKRIAQAPQATMLRDSAVGRYRAAPTVDEALVRIGVELARDLPDFARDDLADEMAKWVKRKGAEHSRKRVAQLLEDAATASGTHGKPI